MDIDDEIKTLQYLYSWLLEDFSYLLKVKEYAKNSVLRHLYIAAKNESTDIVNSRDEIKLHELRGAYEVLRYTVDKEFGYTDAEIASREQERKDFIAQNY